MGVLHGQRAFEKFEAGEKLTRKEAMDAQCYDCNGRSAVDCQGDSCPLYAFFPYKGVKCEPMVGTGA